MIEFVKICNASPYLKFKKKYEDAFSKGQKNIEAASIASYNKDKNQVDSRFVNIKFIDNKKFIFFSNYESPKAMDFLSHDQISVLFFWSSNNTQIRIKAKIVKTPLSFNRAYFKKRALDKNALAISSNQSKPISNYFEVIDNYNKVKEEIDLKKCPEYWGGYAFTPFYFEFWEGHKSRLNKRVAYELFDKNWTKCFIQP